MTTSSKTNKEQWSKYKEEFEIRLAEYVSWELEGVDIVSSSIDARLKRRKEFEDWIDHALTQARKEGYERGYHAGYHVTWRKHLINKIKEEQLLHKTK